MQSRFAIQGQSKFAIQGQSKFAQQPVGQPQEQAPQPTEKPAFMAVDKDKNGTPYYGEGFKGFTRKVFAKIFDPEKILPKPTKEQAALLDEKTDFATRDLEKKGWSQWVESWTGIKASDAAQTAIALKFSMSDTKDGQGGTGNKFSVGDTAATAAGIVYRASGQAIAAGLDALSIFDKVARKGHAFSQAMDQIGDSSTVLPDLTDAPSVLKKIIGNTPTADRLGGFLNLLGDMVPIVAAYDLVRAATSGQSMFQKVQTVKDNLRASNMVYTTYLYEARKTEYMRRIQAGENPDLVMAELEHPWVELAGSIFGDPSTYMGMGIIGNVGKASTPVTIFGKTIFKLPWETVAKIPTFTEILGIKSIGMAKVLNSGSDITKIADSNVEAALMRLQEAGDEKAAVQVLREAVNSARESVRKFSGFFEEGTSKVVKQESLRGTYGIFAYDSAARADIHKKTVGTFFSVLAGRFRNPDDIMETFKAFRNITSADDQIATRAFMHLKEVYGTLPFSEVGMQSMEFMGRLIDEVDVPASLLKHQNNTADFVAEMTGKLSGIVEDMYPSVNDLEKAFKEAKQLGDAATPRQKMLSKAFSDLKETRPAVVWANGVNRALTENKAYRGLQSFYSNTLMGMRPAYAVRNLVQNTFTIWHDLGTRAGLEALTTGTETLVKSIAGKALKQDWAAQVAEREAGKIKDILGFLPMEVTKAIAPAERAGFGFLQAGQDVERVHSAIIARYAVETEMEKFLKNGGIPDVSGLPKEIAESLLTFATKNYGDVGKTMQEFRTAQATGFFETWRHLELDPAFKDTLRRSNLLDELEEIRKFSADSVTFSDRMDAFIKKVEDLAARTADEPALVSDMNPLADSVATVEKAFDEGGRKVMTEEELNQFRALTEARDQLRNKYQDFVDVMRHRVGSMMNAESIRPFEERFSSLRQTLSEGSSKWRNYADELYKGVYAQSKQGVPPTELWNKAQTIMIDMQDGQRVLRKISLSQAYPNVNPAELTNSDFNALLWRWFKDNQSAFWKSYTQEFMLGQDAILKEMAQTVGGDLNQFIMQEYGQLTNPRLQEIADLTKQVEDWQSYLQPDNFIKAGQDFKGKKLSDMTAIVSEFPNWKGGKASLFNAVNAERAAQNLPPYATIDEVPFDEAVQILQKRSKPLPPYVEGTMPTVTRQLTENLKGGFRKALDDFKNGTLTRWGEKTPIESKLDDAMESSISTWVKELDRRTLAARAATARVADETRNFILHDYNKTYADGFVKYGFMYHYWGSRSYSKWLQRGLEAPGWINAFYNYRETMGKVHADQPDFYKYNAQIPAKALFGLNDSPIFLNLEATLNPLYSLTGVDFNDPKRRVDWFSSALDDMGKMGFNTSMPIQWAMAFNLYRKGEDEAARRWMGRLIPATNDLKAGLNLLKDKTGVDLMPNISILPGSKYGEFDPFINAQGGFDAYEEKRIARALSGMIDEGLVTKEEAYDLMRSRQGDMFDEAVSRAINERAPGQLTSYFFGQGFKSRTESDMKVEEFYQKYYKILAMRETMSPDQYRQAVDTLRTDPNYQFADVLLLSARGGDDRDAMYAYNVIGRLPPGDSSQILSSMGLSDEIIQKFYNDKGDFTDWTPQDKERFMSAMVDLGATFAMPDQATRLEWNDAKTAYKDMQEEVSNILGYPFEGSSRGVWDIVSTYYDLKDTNMDKANEFKRMHPEIDQALQMATEAKIQDPMLAKYYVSLDTIETYYFGKTRAQLAEQFGNDIYDIQTEYYDKQLEGKAAAKAFLRQHPELRKYWDAKKKLDAQANTKILEIANALPDAAEGGQLRQDFNPANSTQQDLAQFTGNQVPTWTELSADMAEPLKQQIVNSAISGAPLSDAAMRQLDYLASRNGYYNGDDLLRQAMFSYMQEQQQGVFGQ